MQLVMIDSGWFYVPFEALHMVLYKCGYYYYYY